MTDRNLEMANELRKLADAWVSSRFNYIPLAVAQKMASSESESSLTEYIEGPEITQEDLENFDLLEGYKTDVLSELEEGEDPDTSPEEYMREHNDDAFYELSDGHYPMWGTLFHLRDSSWPEFEEAATNAGFILIRDVPEFDGVMLGVKGAGYSFYSGHWIPMFLAMPFNAELRKKYKGVDYSMV